MLWPTLIVDDFFADPHAVVKLSKTLKYTPAGNGRWPGTRSPPLHEADRDFFLWSTQKIMARFISDGAYWNNMGRDATFSAHPL